MFEKQRQAMNNNAQYQKVKLHIQKNKNTYLLTAGAFGTGMIIRGNMSGTPPIFLTTNPRIGGLAYKSTQTITNTVIQEMVRQGEPGRKTFWVEKQLWFPSRGMAAKASGLSTASVSRCANGLIESAGKQHFIDGGDMV
jgi:hypothetical protein